MNKTELIKAMYELKKATENLYDAVNKFEDENGCDINDLKGFCERFPFALSLDDTVFEMQNWIEDVE